MGSLLQISFRNFPKIDQLQHLLCLSSSHTHTHTHTNTHEGRIFFFPGLEIFRYTIRNLKEIWHTDDSGLTFSIMLIDLYWITLHYIPEGYSLHWHSRENVMCCLRMFITDTVSVNIHRLFGELSLVAYAL
jgi:hypothetical protein